NTPPLCAIEILSPKQLLSDLTEKVFDLYHPSGVLSVWILIPPLNTIHIFNTAKPTLTFTSGKAQDPLMNIEVEMSEIFV
ncbi:MAG: Uma2 family endonuclease, partial [Verrucomicrobia bacterium]|nr:Uma2 family endonuclease [Cytophagales bacterium]